MERFKYDAIENRVARHTLAVKSGSGWGTGTAIKIKDKQLIITAGHVLEGCLKNELEFVWTPGHLQHVSMSEARQHNPMEIKRRMAPLPISDMTFSAAGIKADVGIIVLDTEKLKTVESDFDFFEINDNTLITPIPNEMAVLSGFPEEIANKVRESNTIRREVRLYTEYPDIIPYQGDLPNFDEKIHFQMNVKEDLLAPGSELSSALHGISGAGVWKLSKNPPDEIWRVRIDFIGIQTAVYQPSRTLKGTKIETIFEEIESFLGMHHD